MKHEDGMEGKEEGAEHEENLEIIGDHGEPHLACNNDVEWDS